MVPVKCMLAPQWLRLLSVLRRCFYCCCLLFIVTPIVGVCYCSVFCWTFLYVHSNFSVILMRKRKLVNVHSSFSVILMGRELVDLLSLSFWCLGIFVWLFHAVPWVYRQFVGVAFTDHTHYFWSVVHRPSVRPSCVRPSSENFFFKRNLLLTIDTNFI